MKPALDLKQYFRLIALFLASPVAYARAWLRLIGRGLHYLSENPDLAWAVELLSPPASTTGFSLLVLIAKQGRPVFSLLAVKGKVRNLDAPTLSGFHDLDSLYERAATRLYTPVQTVMVDSTLFDRINSSLAAEPARDAFFITGREALGALRDGLVNFSPPLPEAEMLAAQDGEELLAKFGPRFGVGVQNPVCTSDVIHGLLLALLSPVTRWRMKKKFVPIGKRRVAAFWNAVA